MGLTIDNITKLFSTGFVRQSPEPTEKSQIDWTAFGSAIAKMQSSGEYSEPKTLTKNTLHAEYVQVLDNMYKTRLSYYDAIETIQNSDKTLEIVDKLIQMLANVVSASAPFQPTILDTEPNARQALQACKEFNERCDVYLYDRALLKKLIINGEAFLGTMVQVGSGIVELNDVVEAKRILPCYRGFKIKEYLGFMDDFKGTITANGYGGQENKVRIDRNLLIHFAVNPQRYALADADAPELIGTGMSVLVGTSVLFPALARLYRLKTMEDSADALATADAHADKIIGVPLKDSVKPEDYPEVARTYTDFLRPILTTPTGSASANVSTSSGSMRVLPYPQGQGKPEVIQFPGSNAAPVETRIQALSDSIDKTLGTSAANGNRSQVFSNNDQIVKRLTDVLECRRRAWKEAYLRNLTFLGIYVNPANFDVKMEALPDYGVFAEAEGIAHLVDSLRRITDYFMDVKNKQIFKEADSGCLLNAIEQFLGNRYPVFKGMFHGNLVFKVEQPESEDTGRDSGSSGMGGGSTGSFGGGFGGSGGFDSAPSFSPSSSSSTVSTSSSSEPEIEPPDLLEES